jgi:pimeloyl-ACP methyl ester carboxylesterase
VIRWATALALLAAPSAADTYVLVHGAWVGEWAWDGVADRLRAAGHSAIAVALPGMGSRADEAAAGLTVQDSIDAIVAVIAAQPEPVILVAHSWGGRPATGAWDVARDSIAHVVLVEAVGPVNDDPPALRADGESLSFVVTFQPDIADTGLMPPPGIAEVPGHPLAAMSLAALYGEVPLTRGPLPPTPGTYVWGIGSSLPNLHRYGDHLQDWRGWTVTGIEGGHNLPETNPGGLAAVLLQLAG